MVNINWCKAGKIKVYSLSIMDYGGFTGGSWALIHHVEDEEKKGEVEEEEEGEWGGGGGVKNWEDEVGGSKHL